MTWLEDRAEVVQDLFTEAGEEATYNGRPITLIDLGGSDSQAGSGVTVSYQTRSVLIRDQEVARPQDGDTLIHNGITYSVSPHPQPTAGVWTVELVKEIVSL